jgi:hypothetical protein
MRLFALPVVLFCFAAAVCAQSGPRIVYSKSFPGSIPAWVEISVDKTGAGVYKEDPKDDDPLLFQLSEPDTSQIFSLADRLDHFSHPLESKLKVANMGMKSFRYEDQGAPKEVKFNYSEDADARSLADWFDRIVETERDRIELELAVRFDKLGAQNAILQIEVSRSQKRLIAEQQFLPLLDRVAKNESFLHMARERAAALADSIRGSK